MLLLSLVVEEAPVISADDDVINADAGHTVVIPCQAIGAPRPQITWFKDRSVEYRTPLLTAVLSLSDKN